MNATIYQVAPRFTPGSPAQVDARTAEQVARDELAAFQSLQDCQANDVRLTADDERKLAQGLGGVVEARDHRRTATVLRP